ncbi:hypothetical protein K438DRAFT_2012730 [Mycena galopus ATCC 62051]|nr:hypothetical protein K438DRAFT_2012730 [Mycena galopus ATCC 62051]
MYLNTVWARSAAVFPVIPSLPRFSTKDHVLLFALWPGNASSSELTDLVQKLTALSPRTIGCLSGPLPGHDHRKISCSVAMFESNTCFPFRSEIPGTASPQVGRRHSFRQKGPQTNVLDQDVPSGNVDWGSVWDQNLTNNELPSGLQSLNPDDVGTIIYFTDTAPEGLVNALTRFPGATKLGLFATPTPFITGRPVTLFQDDKIYGAGAVGLALRRPKANARVTFLGMEPFCPPMLVTKAEGNLVISLDNKNPTQLLLAAIQAAGADSAASGLFKDSDAFSLATLQGEELHQMYAIMSGDPSRGTIALRSMSSPPVGSRVQFWHRPKSRAATVDLETINPWNSRQKTLGFMTCEQTRDVRPADAEDEPPHIVTDTFLAASEGGFISSRALNGRSEAPWSSAIPGSLATLNWI